MSYRREPRTVPERIAAIEEQLRRTTTTVTTRLSQESLAALAANKGDLLVAVGPGEVVALEVGPDGSVLTADSSAQDGVAWEDPAGGAELLAWIAL